MKMPTMTQFPIPCSCPSCTRSKRAANITPAAIPLHILAHWGSISTKKNGIAPNHVAAAIARGNNATMDTVTLVVPPSSSCTVSPGFSPSLAVHALNKTQGQKATTTEKKQ